MKKLKLKYLTCLLLLTLIIGSGSVNYAVSANDLITPSGSANDFLYDFELMNYDKPDTKATHIDGIEAMLTLKGEIDEAIITYFNPALTSVENQDKSIVSYALNKKYIDLSIAENVYNNMSKTEAANYLLKGLNLDSSTSLESMGITALSGSKGLSNEAFKKTVVEAMFALNPKTNERTIHKIIREGHFSLFDYSYQKDYYSLHKPYLVPDDTTVDIANKPLKEAICSAMEWQVDKTVSVTEPLNKSDLFLIDEIVINEDIDNFEGIEHLPNLRILALNKKAHSLDGLEKAANLKELTLRIQPKAATKEASTFSLSPLAHMTNLEHLTIDGSGIYNQQLTKEQEKYKNPVLEDLDVLENMTKMGEMRLNDLDIKDISVFQNMTKLYSLDVTHNDISSIDVVKNMPMLIKLVVNRNPIQSIDVANNCTELLDISADHLELKSIDNLKDLSKLRYLSIQGNDVTDISVVEDMPALKRITITSNPIEMEALTPYYDIIEGLPFGDRTFLKKTYTFKSPVIEEAIKAYLGKTSGAITYRDLYCVETLDLADKELTDITDLRNLRNLKYLDLRNNNITDYKHLSGLNELSYLYLEGNPGTNYGGLISVYGTLYDKDFEISSSPATYSDDVIIGPEVHTIEDLDKVILLSLNSLDQKVHFKIVNPSLKNINYIFERDRIFKEDYEVLTEVEEVVSPGQYRSLTTTRSSPSTGLFHFGGSSKANWSMRHENDDIPVDTIQNKGEWIASMEPVDYYRWKNCNKVIPSSKIEALAKKITAGKQSDYDKVKAVHDWVAKNIAYDVEQLRHLEKREYDKIPNYSVEDLLTRKKGICADYASLSRALLTSVGIETHIVNGFGTGSGQAHDSEYSVLKTSSPSILNTGNGSLTGHAWNISWADGRWVEYDTTWDAGGMRFGEDKFIPDFEETYFDQSLNIRGGHTYISLLSNDINLFKSITLQLSHQDNQAIANVLGKQLVQRDYTIYDSIEIKSSIMKEENNYVDVYGFVKEGTHYAVAASLSENMEKGSAYLLKKDTSGAWIILKEEKLPEDAFILDSEVLIFNLFLDGMKNY